MLRYYSMGSRKFNKTNQLNLINDTQLKRENEKENQKMQKEKQMSGCDDEKSLH